MLICQYSDIVMKARTGNLQVNGERLWASLMALAEIGATPKGGVCRLAASDLDGEARQLSIGGCEAAGYAVDRTAILVGPRCGTLDPTG
jgi:beta-ureidopropionase / N-carbamoyl-L-amino-acid hydrolase